MAKHRVRKFVMAAGVVAFGGVVIGGPLSSGGVFLTRPALTARDPVTLPWLEPYHKGGIDFATGIYVRNDQDLIVRGGDLPVVLQRTYNSKDPQSGAFGVGTSHNGEWYLVGDGQRFQWAQLVMAEGSRIEFGRTTWGTSVWNAMFEHTATPTVFYQSKLGWTGTRWALRWYDGSVAIFRSCSPRGNDRCSIVEMRSPAGLTVEYIRTPDTHALQTMRSGEAEIGLHYDDRHRIVRARGSHGQEVGYEYDSGGRLIRVAESSGVVRRYTYDKRGAMLTIDEPRWHIENRYDADGRCIHQRTRFPNGRTWEIEVAYKIGKGGRTETTTASETGGRTTVYHFGDDHYGESKELDPDGPWPVAIVYLRNPGRSFATSVAIRCYDAQKRLLRTVDGEYKSDDETDEMAALTCREWAESVRALPARPQPPEPADPTSPPVPSRPVDPAVIPRRSI
jgi:YD repeat-containing protein